VSPSTFSSREETAKKLEKWLVQERANVLLYGMFGVGKTRFIRDFVQRTNIKQQCKIYKSTFEKIATLDEFWGALLSPVSNTDLEKRDYRTLRTNLETQLQRNRQHCVFILDDFDVLVENLSVPDLDYAMNHLFALQKDENLDVAFVIIASTKTAFLALDKNKYPDIYRVFKEHVPYSIGLRPFSPEEAEKEFARQVQSSLSPTDLKKIVDESGGHPGLIVHLLDSYKQDDKRAVVPDDYLTRVWTSLDEGEQAVLQWLARFPNNYRLTPEAETWLQAENGLIKEGRVFSDLFERYVRAHTKPILDEDIARAQFGGAEQKTTVWEAIRHDWSFTLMLFVLWFVPIEILLAEEGQAGLGGLVISSFISLTLLFICALIGLWSGPDRSKHLASLWGVLTLCYALATVRLYFVPSIWFFVTFLGAIFTSLVLWRIIDWQRGDR
jgi:hypothetical protein